MGRTAAFRLFLTAAGLVAAMPASAQEPSREFCADRPGLGTPACILDSGHVQVELGLADWTLERAPGQRTDTWLAGDLLVRLGIADHAELQLGWTAFGHLRERIGNAVQRQSSTGDVTIALRRSLLHPGGDGARVAVMPYASLPTGGGAIGAGTWSAGVEIPFGFDLSSNVALEFAPKVEAAADSDGDGRHLAYGGVATLDVDFSDRLTAAAELSATRDDDPSGHGTQTLAGLSVGWMAHRDFQLDAGVNLGLDRAAPDVELYAGVSRRF